MIKYFETTQNLNGGYDFIETEFIQNHHIAQKLKGRYINENAIVISVKGGTPCLNILDLINFIQKQTIKNIIIDFISDETYIEKFIVEQLILQLSNYNLKILTVNLVNNQFHQHKFFSNHIFQLVESFGDIIEASNRIQYYNLNTKKRLKKFLFLNHHLRTERFKIFESLYFNSHLDDGLVTFNWNLENQKFNAKLYQVSNDDLEYIKKSEAYRLLPIQLDGDVEFDTNPHNITDSIQNPVHFGPPNTNVVHYFETYFEILTEGYSNTTPFHTFVDRNNLLHYSEKIWKPLLFGNPFCFWGPENTFNELKKYYGFSFECPLYYCNVGYNLIDFNNHINNIISLPYRDLHNMYYEYKNEFMHNQQTLISIVKNIVL